MTRAKAIELVKSDLLECDPDSISEISEISAISTSQKEWEVTCKYKRPFETPLGQTLDSVTYVVTEDGTVLAIPT